MTRVLLFAALALACAAALASSRQTPEEMALTSCAKRGPPKVVD